jgi:lysozyme
VIDWEKVKTDTVPAKLLFVISKATQGTTLVDKKFYVNFKNAKSNGYLAGAYHFYSQKAAPVEQAKHFIQTVKLEKGHIKPIVDVEKNCLTGCDVTPDLLVPK